MCNPLLIRWFAVFQASSFNGIYRKRCRRAVAQQSIPAAENSHSMAEAQISGPLDGRRILAVNATAGIRSVRSVS